MAISAFCRRNVDLPAMLGPVSSQMRPAAAPAGGDRSQSLATNGSRQRLLDHGMAAALDHEIERAVDLRPHIIALDRELRERRRDIERGERLGRGLDVGARRGDGRREPLEDLELEAERAVGGAGDLRFEFAELGGGEAHLAGERLAVDEASR